MSRNDSKAPLLKADRSPTPSSALDALRGNLDAADVASDAGLTLGKKKSWFGSLQDVVQKSALQAKATINVFRSEQHPRAETPKRKPKPDGEEETESPARRSIDSIASTSTTPLRLESERRNAFKTMPAVSSLRQHLPSAMHRARGSVHTIAGPERRITTPIPQDDAASTQIHKRQVSVASSLVGSIRRLNRKAGATRPSTPATAPEKPAETIPLPSSPIDIPNVAPALELDLGPMGFMSPAFNRSPEGETMKLTDPANITTGVPVSYHLHIHEPAMSTGFGLSIDRSVAPGALFQFPDGQTGHSPPSQPSTPMPGTNFSLEVDGANSNKSQVFERSVTPPNARERKEIRAMASLDAMADACTVAHANDDAAANLNEMNDEDISNRFAAALFPARNLEKPRGDATSASTATSCPFDMPELTRQKTTEKEMFSHDHKRQQNGMTDPFNDDHAASGPPSPVRSVELAFRPKVDVEAMDTLSPVSLETQLELQRNLAVADCLAHLEERPAGHDFSEQSGVPDNIASGDDTQTRVQQLLTSDVVLPNYDNDNSYTNTGLSPYGGPLIAASTAGVDQSQMPTMHSRHSQESYTSEDGDAEYKFTFENWLKSSSSAPVPDAPMTPDLRSVEMSLDTVSSIGDRKTPQISPTSTNPDCTPSMGNRLHFDLTRSQHNMRYNALHQQSTDENSYDFRKSSPYRQPLRFIVGTSEEMEDSALRLADFESAYAGSREASPLKITKPLQERVGSEDSVTNSLKDAATMYYQLEERLVEPSRSRINAAEAFSPAAPPSPPGSMCSAGFSFYNKIPSHTSLSEEEKEVAAHTGPLDPIDFSPTSARDNASPNRFKPLKRKKSVDQHDPGADNTVVSVSSSESPLTSVKPQVKNRAGSPDTLDDTLPLFSSPESGYQADMSSATPEDQKMSKGTASRYRSLGRRSGAGRPLGEISKNIV